MADKKGHRSRHVHGKYSNFVKTHYSKVSGTSPQRFKKLGAHWHAGTCPCK